MSTRFELWVNRGGTGFRLALSLVALLLVALLMQHQAIGHTASTAVIELAPTVSEASVVLSPNLYASDPTHGFDAPFAPAALSEPQRREVSTGLAAAPDPGTPKGRWDSFVM